MPVSPFVVSDVVERIRRRRLGGRFKARLPPRPSKNDESRRYFERTISPSARPVIMPRPNIANVD